MDILFVCTGNTCRSPMAEGILRDRIKNDKIKIDSAGIFADKGSPVSQNALRALGERGIDLSGHRSKSMTDLDLDAFDLILTMTKSHKAWILQNFKHLEHKVFTLKEYNSQKSAADILDPFGGDLREYRRCAKEIEENMDKLILFLKTAT